MHFQIFCIMVSVAALDDSVRSFLFWQGRKLLLSGDRRLTFKHSKCEGEICTDYSSACMGAVSGLVLKASVDCADGVSTKVEYLIRERDIEDLDESRGGYWLSLNQQLDNPEFS